MPKKSQKYPNHDALSGYLLISPLILFILVICVYPIFQMFYHSFTKWDGLHSTFIGFANFREILGNSLFWKLLTNNLIFIASIPLHIIISLFIAVLLYEKVSGWKFFRAVIFFPSILPTIVVGLIFKSMFLYDGPINTLLRQLHLDFLAIDWLANSASAMAVILMCILWQNVGYGVVIFLAGISVISPTIMEAASLDGANWFQKVFYIILPMLAKSIEFFSITSIIMTFTALFGVIFAITNGGPGYDTTSLEYMIYLKAFKTGNGMGYACALAVILLILIFIVSRLQIFLAEKLFSEEKI